MLDTPRGSRLHVAIFGRRNAGKSSLINAITNQDIALVSEVPGTTTDPVSKAMEVLPIGPVLLIDTAGIDDEGTLGEMRVQKTMKVLEQADVALLVVDVVRGLTSYEKKMSALCEEKHLPLLVIFNKEDLVGEKGKAALYKEYRDSYDYPCLWVSSLHRKGIEELKEKLSSIKPADWLPPAIVGDLLAAGDMVVLVVPIDSAAPKGRLILPQVQTIRDILDYDCMSVVCKETELQKTLASLKSPPKLVVTDSQVFAKVAAVTPFEVPLTSFSILMARYKGDLQTLYEGTRAVDNLKPGDSVLISEACTHHRQEDDIGRVKIPNWLSEKVGGGLNIEFSSGYDFPPDLSRFSLVIHCGACMLNRKEMLFRISQVQDKSIPIVNYGVFIAYVNGILPRVLAPFGVEVRQ